MKNIVVDFSQYDNFCGFGEIARNFSRRLAAADVPGVHFIFILPARHIGEFGTHISYVASERRRQEIRPFLPLIDLWHATDQQFRFRVRSERIISLLTVHDLNYLREKTGLHRLRHVVQMKWRVRRSTAVTTISEYVRDEVERNIGLGEKDCGVIHNAIGDIENIARERPSFMEDGRPFLFTMGQIRRKKNFASLIPMMRFLPGMQLCIAGDDHFAYAAELRDVIARSGCADRIIMPGKISDKEKCWLYDHALAFVFPSLLEGFGIPPLEAMRMGCPVVSAHSSSLPEVCGEHAAYFPDFDAENMARAVEDTIRERGRGSVSALKAREYSLGFSYDAYTRAYISLYLKLLEERQ